VADKRGFIYLHRKILDEKLWRLPRMRNQLHVFLTLLLKATHQHYRLPGNRTLEPGETATSTAQLAKETGLSRDQVVRAFAGLQKDGRIKTRTTNRSTIVTITAWQEYQNRTHTITENNNTSTRTQKDTPAQKPGNGSVKGGKIPYEEILTHLKDQTGKRLVLGAKCNRDPIRARWKEGFRKEDFIQVIDNMVQAAKDGSWVEGKDMTRYLVPETLFRASNMQKYLSWNEGKQMDAWEELRRREAR